MKRTQLYLEERQRRILADQSRVTGKSVGQLVREAVDQVYIASGRSERPIHEHDTLWDYVGGGVARETDVSSRHDHHIYGVE